MTYILITRTPGMGLKEYQAVADELGPEPLAGNLVQLAGETTDGALLTVDVWESSVAADRFAAERLFPAFGRTGVGPGSRHLGVGDRGYRGRGAEAAGARLRQRAGRAISPRGRRASPPPAPQRENVPGARRHS
jgi:hypothetical protein